MPVLLGERGRRRASQHHRHRGRPDRPAPDRRAGRPGSLGLRAPQALAAHPPDVHVAAVSLDPSARVVGAYPWSLQVSADGGTVLWASDDDVTTVAAGQQWYLLHRATGVVTLASAAADGSPVDGMHLVSGAALSGDGGEVLLWDRDATTLLPGGGSAASALLLRQVGPRGWAPRPSCAFPRSPRRPARRPAARADRRAQRGRARRDGGRAGAAGLRAAVRAVVRLDPHDRRLAHAVRRETDGTRCRLATTGRAGATWASTAGPRRLRCSTPPPAASGPAGRRDGVPHRASSPPTRPAWCARSTPTSRTSRAASTRPS